MKTFKPLTGFKPILSTYKFLSLLLIPSFIIIITTSSSFIVAGLFLFFTYAIVSVILLIAQRTTSYQIGNSKIYYKCLYFTKGSLEIASIYKIKLNSSNWSSGMPATTNKGGMSIFYKKYDEIYLSPENNEEFVEEILKIKSDIEIISH